ncbi:hypothetical protein [Shewanella algae]|uniref:hypothetical protein n=1 Tax=Shewanella algae TaxID=38313 RepID=UPI001AADADCB|nr:hypothetical protein [Shewanella algae]QTE96612.1 hypothetical protein JKK45_08975 [Shewanella algae]
MQAVFKQTEGDYLEAVIEVAGQPLTVMDEFGGDSLTYGEIIDIELSVGIACEQEDQNTMLAGNPEGLRKLQHIQGWSYRAFGTITDITQGAVIDVGLCRLEAPFDSNISGESIAFTILRLDARAVPSSD